MSSSRKGRGNWKPYVEQTDHKPTGRSPLHSRKVLIVAITRLQSSKLSPPCRKDKLIVEPIEITLALSKIKVISFLFMWLLKFLFSWNEEVDLFIEYEDETRGWRTKIHLIINCQICPHDMRVDRNIGKSTSFNSIVFLILTKQSQIPLIPA